MSTTLIDERWATGELTGRAKHQLVVRVRAGYIARDHALLQRIDGKPVPHVTPTIFEGNNVTPWQGEWVPLGSWLTLPNIQNAKHTRSFDQNGSSTLTVLMDNIFFEETYGTTGMIFHAIQRGYFSPSRGIVMSSRPDLWGNTGWTDALNGGYQIEIWEGYGPDGDPSVIPLEDPDPTTHSCAPPDAAITRTFTGIIEDCDLESHPDHITMTARDFGVLFTDQRVQGTNKAAEIVAPTIFADRVRTLGELETDASLPPSQSQGQTAASSEFNAHGGLTGWGSSGLSVSQEYAFTPGSRGAQNWWSAPQAAATDVQWLEEVLKPGEYIEFACAPTFSGMKMWVSVYVGPAGGKMDGDPVGEGWVDDGSGSTPDGTPYIGVWENVPGVDQCGAGARLTLGHDLSLPANSRLRVTFTNLSYQDPTYDSAQPFPYDWYWALRGEVNLNDTSHFTTQIAADENAINLEHLNLNFARSEYGKAEDGTEAEYAAVGGSSSGISLHDFSESLELEAYWEAASDAHDGQQRLHWVPGNYSGNPAPGHIIVNLSDFRAAIVAVENRITGLRQQIAAYQAEQARENAQNAQSWQALAAIVSLLQWYNALWDSHKVANPGYYAAVETLKAMYLSTTAMDVGQGRLDPSWAPVNAHGWVLVDDASQVIVEVCIWLGFKEWNIDPFGWSLVNPMQWGSDKYFIDIVNDILNQGNYVFFMGPPTDDDRSIGVPCFKRQTASAPPARNMRSVTDDDLLEAAEIKWDLTNLPGQFRYRGDPIPLDKQGQPTGSETGGTWEEDLVLTYQATYVPPWAGDAYAPLDPNSPPVKMPNRVAGVMRHFTQTMGVNVTIGLASNEECLFACLLAAVQYAVGMCTGQLQIPGNPNIGLNEQIDVIEEATGINSRMWVASVESNHTLGPNGKWVMVIGGSFVDTEDMALITADYGAAYAHMAAARKLTTCTVSSPQGGGSPWGDLAAG